MSEEPKPGRKLTVRDHIGGFGLMAMGFGVYSFVRGHEVPWGYQQKYGAILFGSGLVVALTVWLWPRKRE